MYGFYGGFTTIYHLIVRFPLLVLCVGVGGATYEALTCPPPPPIVKPADPVIAPIDPPPPVIVVPIEKQIRGDAGSENRVVLR